MNALLEISLQSDCSTREYQSKKLCTLHWSALLQFPFTIDYSIDPFKLHTLKYSPDITFWPV